MNVVSRVLQPPGAPPPLAGFLFSPSFHCKKRSTNRPSTMDTALSGSSSVSSPNMCASTSASKTLPGAETKAPNTPADRELAETNALGGEMISGDARALLGGDLHALPVFVRGPGAVNSPLAPAGVESKSVVRQALRRASARSLPTVRRGRGSPRRDQHCRTMVAQRQAAQHSGTIAGQANRQPARDQLDFGECLAPEGGSEAMR